MRKYEGVAKLIRRDATPPYTAVLPRSFHKTTWLTNLAKYFHLRQAQAPVGLPIQVYLLE